MKQGKHWIRDPAVEAAAGVGFLVVAGVLLNDAYERRARKQPLWLRPFAFW